MIRYLILGTLRDGHPRHGYALLKEYNSQLETVVNSGSFYRDLKALLRAGSIALSGATTNGDNSRTSYVITPAGEVEFRQWLLAPPRRIQGGEDDLGTRALFLCGADPEEVLPVVQAWRQSVWLESKVLEQSRSELTRSAATPDVRAGLALLLHRRVATAAADLELLDSLERHLRLRIHEATATPPAESDSGAASATSGSAPVAAPRPATRRAGARIRG